MTPPPTISILMPVKNAGLYLSGCLDSIRNQSYKAWELIAINDHSTDDSFEVLKTASLEDDRIKVFHNDGVGIIEALRLAYKHSSGKMITRMDADDIMATTKLEVLRLALEDQGLGHLALGLVEYFSDGQLGEGYKRYAEWLNGLTATGENFSEIYKECVVPSPCWMIFREDLNSCGAFDSDLYPEDYDLCFRFFMNGLKCIPSSKILHYWRDHSERASRNDEHYQDNRFTEIKVKYFIKSWKEARRPVVLWGAGKKGKLIAARFIQNEIDFHWITNNEKKIGLSIYDHPIKGPESFSYIKKPLLIVAIASPSDQKDLLTLPDIRSLRKGTDLFLFC